MKNANPVSRLLAFGATAILALAACGRGVAETASVIPPLPADPAAPAARYTYEVVRAWPHDRGAFTQGLLVRNGSLLESTGLNGFSSLREVELSTGRVLKQVPVPSSATAPSSSPGRVSGALSTMPTPSGSWKPSPTRARAGA
jgi:glutamine cyclotransferase